ncbi:hypothetical protein D6833_06315 [Candidatus Parcubacteria bacterium]|nr:MAG: hypothetical protein D6833_06315 [Candidatus Parcubacteria bacterium]
MHTVPFTVAVAADAPPGDTVFALVGTTEHASCTTLAQVTVDLQATLQVDPAAIPASTTWPGIGDWSFAHVSVQWNPPECQGQLQIVDIEPLAGYVPLDMGTLTRIDATTWRYDAFTEPQTEKCPRRARVWIAAIQGEVELGRIGIVVRPIHEWLTTGHKHGPGQPMHSPDLTHFMMNYDYLRWKYSTVLATTGGAFSSVSFKNASCVECTIGIFNSPCVAACTDSNNNVVFVTSAFTGTENAAASMIGHELIHTTGADECPAYTWEFNNDNLTGIFPCDPGYLADVVRNMNCRCNGICP